MSALYIRRSINGKRTWLKIGQWNQIDDEWFIIVQVSPGMVYQARIRKADLIRGTLKKGK